MSNVEKVMELMETRSSLPNLLMVGDFDEFVQATHNLGWPKSNVLRTTVVHLEGRRYKSIHITWKAFEIMQGTDALWYMMKTMEAISSVDIVITIGKLKPPPVDYPLHYDMTILPNERFEPLWKAINMWMNVTSNENAHKVAIEVDKLKRGVDLD